MFMECRNYLVDLLRQSGIKKDPYISKKRMKISGESHIGAVLFEREVLEKDLSKRIYTDITKKKKRKKSYQREVSFNVIIGEYEIDKVQEIYEKFLQEIPQGIDVDGNYVEFIVDEADWLDDEDTILKSKCAVQFTVRCIGGVYKDTEFKKFDDIAIEVEKEVSHGTDKEK